MKKQTRKTTKFTQGYNIYYSFGSWYGATISANTKKELDEQRERMIANCRIDGAAESIRFDNVWKVVETDEGGEQDVKLTDEITKKV